MKKMIFTLLLAIVSSVWTMSEATCFASYYSIDEIWGMKTGMVQRVAYPCAEGQDCPTCMTLALVTEANQVWYLIPYNAQIQSQLEALESHINEWYTVEGQPFWHDGYHFMNVREISLASARIPSLCDEWHVLHEPFECMGPYCYLETDIYRFMSDTVISPIDSNTPFQFVKLAENGQYKGALREGTNRDIYYVPAGSTNEFLLYAFNAQVGEVLNDLYLGGFEENGYSGRVEAISDGSPRLFTIRVLYPTGMGVEPGESFSVTWIEGVGSPETPYGLAVVPTVPADIGVFTLLCAYKDGEQAYSSPKAQKYGCEFNGYDIPQTPTTDTIPLYAQDDPGSSTVDPVDPNQVVATLQGDQLTIHENSGEDITYSLQNTSSQQAPAQHRAPQSDTFRNEVTVQLSEYGFYTLTLTNPSWDYSIVGSFRYMPEDIGNIRQGEDRGRLILCNGQLIILRGDNIYTLQGQKIK